MYELKVSGMTCGHCVQTVTRAIQTIDANASVEVDLASGRVVVGTSRREPEIRRAIEAGGFQVHQKLPA